MSNPRWSSGPMAALVFSLMLVPTFLALGQKEMTPPMPRTLQQRKAFLFEFDASFNKVVVNHEEQIRAYNDLLALAKSQQRTLAHLKELARTYRSGKMPVDQVVSAVEQASDSGRQITSAQQLAQKIQEMYLELQKAAQARHDMAKGIIGNIRA